MRYVLLIVVVLLGLPADSYGQRKKTSGKKPKTTTQKKVKYDRLPPDVELGTEVRRDVLNDKGEVVAVEVTTVEKRLRELKARYRKDLLVDSKGREIRFFHPLCRGVSAGAEEDEQERRAKDEELAALRQKYTVIILYCDPRQVM
ncbi:MAG: hypothetical protein JSS81_03755 [Acidobacteria bacterium]|nr:hypothetical protein [Acidobacteriota bacterium]